RGRPTNAWSETAALFQHSERRLRSLPPLWNSRQHLCFCNSKHGLIPLPPSARVLTNTNFLTKQEKCDSHRMRRERPVIAASAAIPKAASLSESTARDAKP